MAYNAMGVIDLTDILIRNGAIVDGTGRPGYEADVAVSGGKIKAIGKGLSPESGEIIDASGLIVCPGFIDVHSHNDLVPFMNKKLGNLKLLQGVTTELVGQCGLGVVPCIEGESRTWKNYTRGVVGDPGIDWEFNDLNKYFDDISKRGLKNNYAALISHGAVRTHIMGFDNRPPSDNELAEMCGIVDEAMKQSTSAPYYRQKPWACGIPVKYRKERRQILQYLTLMRLRASRITTIQHWLLSA